MGVCVVSGQENAHAGQDPVSAVHTKVKVLLPGPVTLHCPGVAVVMVAVTVIVTPACQDSTTCCHVLTTAALMEPIVKDTVKSPKSADSARMRDGPLHASRATGNAPRRSQLSVSHS